MPEASKEELQDEAENLKANTVIFSKEGMIGNIIDIDKDYLGEA